MGYAAAIGAAGTLASSAAQRRAAEEQAKTAEWTTQAEIADRAAARERAGLAANEAIGQLGGYEGRAIDAIQRYGGHGMDALTAGLGQSSGYLQGAGQSALASLAAGYGGAAQAMGQGYGQAAADYASMPGAYDVAGRASVMGTNEAALQRAFAQDPGAAMSYQAGMGAAPRGMSQEELAALGRYNQGVAAQGYGAFTARDLAGQQVELGALQDQARRSDAMARARASGLAALGMGQGADMSQYLAGAGQSLAGQQWRTGAGLSDLASALASQRYGASMGLGSQLSGLYGNTGANLASILTGNSQLDARLGTGIDRSALVSTAGSDYADRAGLLRDLGQIGFLAAAGRGGSSRGYSGTDSLFDSEFGY